LYLRLKLSQMEYWIIILISATAFGTAILTFFSGFGLGTILSPVFALFFPIDIAIALTAVVHFSSNLFKLSLMGKFASKEVLLKFAPTALIGALIGAYALGFLKDLTPIETHQWFGVTAEITWVKLIIAILLALFAIVELLPISEHFEMKIRILYLVVYSADFLAVYRRCKGLFGRLFWLRRD